MKQPAQGRINERITAIGTALYPTYVVRGETKNLMIDAGINLMAPHYLAALRDVTHDEAGLDCLFLTHSHYDHIGAASYIRQHIPGLKIGAHESLAGLLQKPSVLETMNRLSANHVDLLEYNVHNEDLVLRPFEIDLALKQGDEFDLGGLTCHVYETPGHTRDSLAFYFPEIGALFPGEACGLAQDEREGEVQVEFLASYQEYLDSLERLSALRPQLICLGHGQVLTQDDAVEFLSRSHVETSRYRELIEGHLDAAAGDVDEAIRAMAHAEYDVKGGIRQERTAYLINLTAQIKHIAGLR
ncbi:MAG: MBL fold metallo-hydrolase [Thermoleophilia bacterium]